MWVCKIGGEWNMTYVKTLDVYINKVEDLRDRVEEDVYEVVEELVYGSMNEISNKYEDLKYEFEVYESSLEECRSTITEQTRVLYDTSKEIENLIEYLDSASRINRDKIKNILRKIDLVDIADQLSLSI